MLADANVTPANMAKLGESFQKLNGTVANMGEIGDVIKSTVDFSAKTKEATIALNGIKESVNHASTALAGFHGASDTTKQFHVQMQALNKNLSSLNTIYELELQEGNNNLKAMNQFYNNLVNASQDMEGSVDDAKKAHDQIAVLANNLGRLNNIYGNKL